MGRLNEKSILPEVEDLPSDHLRAVESHKRRVRSATMKVAGAASILLLCLAAFFAYRSGKFSCSGHAHLTPSPITLEDVSTLPTGVQDTAVKPTWSMAAYVDEKCSYSGSYGYTGNAAKSCVDLPGSKYKRVDWEPAGFRICLYSKAGCNPSDKLVSGISREVHCSKDGNGAKSWKVITGSGNC